MSIGFGDGISAIRLPVWIAHRPVQGRYSAAAGKLGVIRIRVICIRRSENWCYMGHFLLAAYFSCSVFAVVLCALDSPMVQSRRKSAKSTIQQKEGFNVTGLQG